MKWVNRIIPWAFVACPPGATELRPLVVLGDPAQRVDREADVGATQVLGVGAVQKIDTVKVVVDFCLDLRHLVFVHSAGAFQLNPLQLRRIS
jgi:hypothetical protein